MCGEAKLCPSSLDFTLLMYLCHLMPGFTGFIKQDSVFILGLQVGNRGGVLS